MTQDGHSFTRNPLRGIVARAIAGPRVFAVVLACWILPWSGCARFGAEARGDALIAAGNPDAAAQEYAKALVPGQRNLPVIARLGVIYAEQGRFPRARELLGEAVEAAPDNLELRFKLAQVRLALGEVQGARVDALVVLKGRPDHPEAPLLLVNASRGPALEAEARRELEGLPAVLQGRAPVLTALASLDARAGNMTAAEAGLRRAMALDPTFAPTYQAFADYWQRLNRPDRVTAALRSAAEVAPLRSPHVIRWFWHQLETKDYAGARSTAERVLKAHPGFPPALLAMAFVSARQQRREEALQFAEHALDAEIGLAGAYVIAAQLRLQRGEPAVAMVRLKAWMRRYPTIASAHYLLAAAHAAARQPELARDSLRRAIEIDAALKDVGLLTASPFEEKKEGDRRAALMRAFEIWPDAAAVTEALVRLDLAEGKREAATRRAKAWVEREPTSARALFVLGQVGRDGGDLALAAEAWTRAVKVDPDYLPASLELAELHVQAGRTPEAEAVIARVLERQPQVSDALVQQASLLERAGKWEAARDLYQGVIERGGASAVACRSLAALLAERFHDLDRALVMARRARDLAPQSGKVLGTLGWIHHLRGEYRQALPLLEKAAAETPDLAEAQFKLGRTQVMLGDASGARRALQRALALGLETERAAEAQRLLAELTP